jgi:hypothetical protein
VRVGGVGFRVVKRVIRAKRHPRRVRSPARRRRR